MLNGHISQLPYAMKSYGSPEAYPLKALGGDGASHQDLSQWWKDEWYPWFRDFLSGGGKVAQIDPQLLDSAVWAAGQLGIDFNPWDPTSFDQDSGEVHAHGPQPDDWGGFPGANQNIVYDGSDLNIGIDGSPYVHDIWGTDITLFSDSHLLSWTFEESLAGNPQEKVLKLTVHNQQSGQDTVYNFHNIDEIHSITFQTANGKPVNLIGNVGNLTNADGEPLVQVEACKPRANQEGGDGLPINPNAPENTLPEAEDQWIDEDTPTYNTHSDVNLTAYYGDDVMNYRITAPGTVVLHGSNYGNTFEYAFDDSVSPPQLVVKIHKEGWKLGDAETAENTEVFTIVCGPNTKVVLDVMGESSVVQALGEPGSHLQIGMDGAGGSNSAAGNEVLQELLQETGKSEAQLLNALKDAGYPYESIEDLKAAMAKDPPEFPPADVPNTQLIMLLYMLDPEFHEKASKAVNQEDLDANIDATERLITLLDLLYRHEENIYRKEPATNEFTMMGHQYLVSYECLALENEGNQIWLLRDGNGSDDKI